MRGGGGNDTLIGDADLTYDSTAEGGSGTRQDTFDFGHDTLSGGKGDGKLTGDAEALSLTMQ